MVFISLAVFFIMLILGFPLFITILATALTGFLYLGGMGQLRVIIQQFYGGISLFPLLAVPYFILVGELMNFSGMSVRLLRFAQSLVGHTKGGLGYITVVTSILFSGINGSAAADASAVGSIMLPAMKKDGYPPEYAASLVASSSLIGPIIPPSIFMILLASLIEGDAGELFIAGIIPGLLLGLAFMLMNRISAKKLNLPVSHTEFSFKTLLHTTMSAMPALIAPGIIIFGILFGIMTPTESGAVASLYVIFVGLFWTRELSLSNILKSLSNTIRLTSVVFLIVGSAIVLGWLLTYYQVTKSLVPIISQYTTSPTQLLLIISLITFLVGMFMEEVAALVLLTPVFYPLAAHLGVDPLHFGIVMTLNITIALITPPMGACIYIVSSIGGVPLEKMFKTIWSFVLVALFCQILIITIPSISLQLPRLLGY